MNDLPTTCIICGKPIEPAMVKVPCIDKYVPREVCDACADPKPRPAVKRHYSPPTIIPYIMLAGAIERSVLKHYRHLYKEALKSAFGIQDDMLTEKEQEFIRFHRSLENSAYHSALTFARMPELLDSTRREVERETPEFRALERQGYNIFERSEST